MATMHQLGQLIDGVKAANKWSDPDLVRNAKEKGHVLSKSNIARYRDPFVSIKGSVILALAAGMRVTAAQVAVAAIESMGIPLPQYDTPTPEQAVQMDSELSARDRAAVLALLVQLRASAKSDAPPEGSKDKKISEQLANDGEPDPLTGLDRWRGDAGEVEDGDDSADETG